MFTGIIQSLGSVKEIKSTESGRHFLFQSPELTPDINRGDSICCSGVCLSAVEVNSQTFLCYAVKETLEKTNLKQMQVGDKVNFELAMLPSTRVGGHFVNGHIDTTVKVVKKHVLPDNTVELSVQIPKEFLKYCVPKGSLALNGVSLTIAHIHQDYLTVALIPVTLEITNLGSVNLGDELNLEVDSTGKYIETFFKHYINQEAPDLLERWVK